MIHVPKNSDFWAGALFVGFAIGTFYLGSSLSLGTAREMGPGYFPALVAAILFILGLVTMARGLTSEAAEIEPGKLRPFLVIVAVLAFSLLLHSAGLLVAVAAAVLISGLAIQPVNKVTFSIGIAAFLALLSWAVFITGLGLPLQVGPF